MTKREQHLACTLSGPELVGRIQEWASVASHAKSRHVEEGRVVSAYPSDPQLLERMQKLIAAESECCPFLHFDIQQKAEEMIVELRVPKEMTEALAVMLGLVTDATSAPASV
jgi:hypothetical protein